MDEVNAALDKIKISRNEGLFGDYCIISEALTYVVENSDASVNNYIFDFYNQTEAIYEDNIADDLLEKIKSRNINISIISPEAESVTGYQKMLSDSTGGIIIDKSGNINYRKLYQHVYDKKAVDQSFSAILITGYQLIELKGKLSAYNNIDTDDDTLTDWEEVGVEHWIENGLITYDVSGNIMLPTIEKCMGFTECSYVEEGLERFQSDYGINFGAAIAGARVLPIKSDPTNKDSDFDGVDDADEDLDKRLTNSFSVTWIAEKGKYENILYTMDYSQFFKPNTQYNRKISTISSLMAALAYDDQSLADSSDETEEDNYVDQLMRKHGMEEEKIYKLADYYDDQHLCDVAFGHHRVELDGTVKEVIAIVIRGTNGTVAEWSSNFDIGCDDIFYNNNPIPKNEDWVNAEHHMGFDIAATRVIKLFDKYLSEIKDMDDSATKTLWITGHSRGAGIANIVGAKLDNKYETFVYTFASPLTTTVSDAEVYSHKSIFNIVNGDDIIPYLPLQQWGFKRYGEDRIISVNKACKSQWEEIAGSYNSNVSEMNNLLSKFYTLSSSRDECYMYTCTCHGNGKDDSICLDSDIFSTSQYTEKYCIYSTNEMGGQRICQSTAYFMQYLAELAAESGNGEPLPFINTTLNAVLVYLRMVAPKYTDCKNAFKNYGNFMRNPHEPISYYVLSKC
ncbi:MAG: lipase family protein [Ruminococcaceae bacterium]|nr:lipase family protein [Oscillospiraceae bacterium]